ncbi:hypothetical protein [Mycobacterium persicum]|uniref:Uncharacterized protein n=1 Tax=Mycobacterium persicum TaxID=1487726 RepID=A0A8E2IVA7_9MYCO|nr:hypothetical protein [Mycobacterium persicum]KZS85046.1 hypothetical protein A4G31_25285 [Mycobacterium persicum]ORB92169.1 hypothetical protein B1T49_26235 [Mycobacterium persicum]ORB97556.1 hypothetical protein B1T44_27020 [Mycobacterium persicum]ORC04229.1 hypothetical protein B1T48_26305 [Mycobacterium persicum]ORC09628.1 hypothetical protein B4U45_26540 [Mycobacterium persicum]
MTKNDIPHLHSKASATDESYRDFGSCDWPFPEQFHHTNFSAGMQISPTCGLPATAVHGTVGVEGDETAYLVPVTNSIAYRNAIEILGDRRRP